MSSLTYLRLPSLLTTSVETKFRKDYKTLFKVHVNFFSRKKDYDIKVRTFPFDVVITYLPEVPVSTINSILNINTFKLLLIPVPSPIHCLIDNLYYK